VTKLKPISFTIYKDCEHLQMAPIYIVSMT